MKYFFIIIKVMKVYFNEYEKKSLYVKYKEIVKNGKKVCTVGINIYLLYEVSK